MYVYIYYLTLLLYTAPHAVVSSGRGEAEVSDDAGVCAVKGRQK